MAIYPSVPAVVTFTEEVKETQDLKRFDQQVRERYNEDTLLRLLQESEDPEVRLAVLLALSTIGTFASTPAIARCLLDDDEMVRGMAERVLGCLWIRADTILDSIRMYLVRTAIDCGDMKRAVMLASLVIKHCPRCAEAYHLRAIAYRRMKQWRKSIADSLRALKRNPHHFGATLSMGKCYLKLGDVKHAIMAFVQAMRMNRNLRSLQRVIDHLRASLS